MTTITVDRALLEQTLQALVRTYHYGGVIAADAECITALRAALAQQAKPQGCDHCNHPLYAATKCRVCGRVTEQAEPVEPVAWVHTDAHNPKVRFLEWTQQAKGYRGDWIKTPLCNCAPPRQSDPQIEDRLARHGIPMPGDPK